MSRAGRGGRGGYSGRPGVDSNPSTRAIPFDVDPELADAAQNGDGDSDGDLKNGLFPALDEYLMAGPVTEEERRGVQFERDFQAKRRAGPFWTGTKEDWADVDGNRHGLFNPFHNAATYGKKRKRQTFQLANLKKVKVCYPQFLPKELQDIVKDTADVPGKKSARAKKSAADKLAKVGDGEDDEGIATAEDEPEDDEEEVKEKDEDDLDREPENDDFDEDDEDADNDYNAEKYFDAGDDDIDDYEGDDYGGGEDGY